MKPRQTHWNTDLKIFEQRDHILVLQAPLPNFRTWPILLSIKGQGNVLAGCVPLAPPEEPAHD